MEDIATFVEPSTLEFFTSLRATKLLYITQVKKEESVAAEDRYLEVEVNIFARSADIGYERQKFNQKQKQVKEHVQNKHVE